jgi:hypothetical protein
VNAFGQVVERDFVGGASRVVGGFPSYSPATVFGGVQEIDRVNAFGQVVERDFVGGVPRVMGGSIGAPITYAGGSIGAPISYAAPQTTTVVGSPAYSAPTTVYGGVQEIDRVNAFGQVVERDFVGGAPRVVGGFPSYAPATVVGGVQEIDRVNAFGQVVERDFVGGRMVSTGVPTYAPTTIAAPTTVAYSTPSYAPYAAPTVVSGSYLPPYAPATVIGGGVAEVDRVNAFGQVVERDFYGGAPFATATGALL